MLKQLICSDAPEQALRYYGFHRIAGVDEVGRGALFGPVVAAAVILPECLDELGGRGFEGLQATDARGAGVARRTDTANGACDLRSGGRCRDDRPGEYLSGNAYGDAAAVQGLTMAPDHLLIDAMRLDHPCRQTKLIYGDALSLSIAAASVVAKVHRDALMRELDAVHPGYGLASHKGYGTPEHRRALAEIGPCALHRRSFAPVREVDPDAVMEEIGLSGAAV
jgi:ribonuclease HII